MSRHSAATRSSSKSPCPRGLGPGRVLIDRLGWRPLECLSGSPIGDGSYAIARETADGPGVGFGLRVPARLTIGHQHAAGADRFLDVGQQLLAHDRGVGIDDDPVLVNVLGAEIFFGHPIAGAVVHDVHGRVDTPIPARLKLSGILRPGVAGDLLVACTIEERNLGGRHVVLADHFVHRAMGLKLFQDLGVPGDLAEVLEVVDAVETFRQPAAPKGEEIVEVGRRPLPGSAVDGRPDTAHQQGVVLGPETGRITGVVKERAEPFARFFDHAGVVVGGHDVDRPIGIDLTDHLHSAGDMPGPRPHQPFPKIDPPRSSSPSPGSDTGPACGRKIGAIADNAPMRLQDDAVRPRFQGGRNVEGNLQVRIGFHLLAVDIHLVRVKVPAEDDPKIEPHLVMRGKPRRRHVDRPPVDHGAPRHFDRTIVPRGQQFIPGAIVETRPIPLGRHGRCGNHFIAQPPRFVAGVEVPVGGRNVLHSPDAAEIDGLGAKTHELGKFRGRISSHDW